MTPDCLSRHYREVWLVDTEFHQPAGEQPKPICLAARELFTGREVQRWLWDDPAPLQPFYTEEETLFVAYYASAELGVYLAACWPIPERILDLYAEFRRHTCGRPELAPCGHGLLGGMAAFGLPTGSTMAKEGMRSVAIRGGPFTAWERRDLLAYCQGDVDALADLFQAMMPHIDLPRALLRGRYMAAVANMERAGIPIDTGALADLRNNWSAIQTRLIDRIDRLYAGPDGYGVYDHGHFDTGAFEQYLVRNDIPWPRLPSGALELSEDAFGEMALTYPAVKPLHDLRVALAQLKEWQLAVGSDGRNRCLLSPFASRTSRNQPSTAKYIFGPAVWLRSLIRPEPGMAVAYVDWEQQEFGIGAALSGDRAMMDAYQSGDPYLTFARQARAVPADATKQSHKAQRELFKVCALGVQYGMGAEALARRIGKTVAEGRELLRLHRETYPAYWRWSDTIQDHAMLHGYLDTVFGWRVHVGPDANPRSLRNFPLQANGAEMLRLACCLATERGIRVCAPVHDALLVEGPADANEDTVTTTQDAMREASELVLPGFPLRTDAQMVRWPDRYRDERGAVMWELVWEIIRELAAEPVGITRETLNLSPVIPPSLLFSSLL